MRGGPRPFVWVLVAELGALGGSSCLWMTQQRQEQSVSSVLRTQHIYNCTSLDPNYSSDLTCFGRSYCRDLASPACERLLLWIMLRDIWSDADKSHFTPLQTNHYDKENVKAALVKVLLKLIPTSIISAANSWESPYCEVIQGYWIFPPYVHNKKAQCHFSCC